MSRTINEIFVHCSATRRDWMSDQSAEAKRDEIDRWHRQRGWKGFGYHYLIDRDGTVIAGRPEEEIGAHVSGHNAHSIGICLVGGHGSNENDTFADHYTSLQEGSLSELLDKMEAKYPGAVVRGHNEVAAKACPGFNVKRWLRGPRKALSETRTGKGGAVAVVGTGIASIADVADQALSAAHDVSAMAEALPVLRWVGVALTLAGVALMLYARWDDLKAGDKGR